MIKLCRNLFYKPKYGSTADSMVLKQLFSTVTVVLVCLAAISFSAYAYFTCSITSATNKIQASSFSATVSVNPHVDPSDRSDDTETYQLNPGKYTVTITTDTGITGTGYYTVNIAGTDYYTQQLGKDINAPEQERSKLSFSLDVKADTTITFQSCWGTASYYDSGAENRYYIKNDPQEVIVVNAPVNSGNTSTENSPGGTAPDGTIPNEIPPTTDTTEILHIVQIGDSLSSIAEQHGTTYPILAAYNSIENPSIIHPGQKIRIPPADWVIPEKTASATEPAE